MFFGFVFIFFFPFVDVKLGASPESLASIPAPSPGQGSELQTPACQVPRGGIRTTPIRYLSGHLTWYQVLHVLSRFLSPLSCSQSPESAVSNKT